MSAFDTSQSTTTTLPSWFTNAQQNAAQGVTSALGNITQPGQTVGQDLVKSLSGPTNPFAQGIANLADIATGATNPWLASGAPDTSTALGGLFAAQNAKLDQILPSIASKEGAAGIGSGNYGGLRGQTAVDTARAGALTTLAEQQDQAALNALTQGIQADTAMGNLGAQYGTTGVNVANWQQLGALPSYLQASNALNQIGAKTNIAQDSSKNAGLMGNLQSATGLGGSLLGGASNLAKLMGGTGTTGLSWLDNLIKTGSTSGTGSTFDNMDLSWLTNASLNDNSYVDANGDIIGTGTAVGEGE